MKSAWGRKRTSARQFRCLPLPLTLVTGLQFSSESPMVEKVVSVCCPAKSEVPQENGISAFAFQGEEQCMNSA